MSKINTGKPEFAFPSTFKSLSPEEEQVHRWGMTLRDYFAAKALQALIPNSNGDDGELWDAAEDAYAYADAMLKERDKC
jgi:hypothetical protein